MRKMQDFKLILCVSLKSDFMDIWQKIHRSIESILQIVSFLSLFLWSR